jgi:hypothetical protein
MIPRDPGVSLRRGYQRMQNPSAEQMFVTAFLAVAALSWTVQGLFGFSLFDYMGPEVTGAISMLVGGVGVYDFARTFGLIDCY